MKINLILMVLLSTMSILSLLSILTTTTVYAQKDANNENIKLTNETVFDIAIVNGTVIDPETMLDDIKNVGIINGKIASITNKPIKGNQNIDATGLIVSPGFIDMHFHSIDPFGTKLGILDGVTTGGDLEAGVFDVDKFYKDKVRAHWLQAVLDRGGVIPKWMLDQGHFKARAPLTKQKVSLVTEGEARYLVAA